MYAVLFWKTLITTKSPIKTYKALSRLAHTYYTNLKTSKTPKASFVDGRYFWRLYMPGYPSLALDQVLEEEIKHNLNPQKYQAGLKTLLFAITKKCSLNCAHCLEWKIINDKERLSLTAIQHVVNKFQKAGVGQIFFSGGEPLTRIFDICATIKQAQQNTDFWIISSGINFTLEKAKLLKDAGLTGVLISLDHHVKEDHNLFRGHNQSYQWVLKAVKHAQSVGLVTGLSLCPVKEYLSAVNLAAYMELANTLKVSFVQFMEPKAVGRFEGEDVLLQESHKQLLQQAFHAYNFESKYSSYPLISYPGYEHETLGCIGKGKHYMYLDTDALAHPCPFCKSEKWSALDMDIDLLRREMTEQAVCQKGG